MSPRSLEEQFLANGGYFEKCKAETLFCIKGNPQLDKENFTFSSDSEYPYFTRTVFNNGVLGYVDYYDEDHLIKGNSIAVGMMGMQFFYMPHNFYAGQFTKTAFPLFEGFNEWVAQWFISWFNKSSKKFLSLLVRDFEKTFRETEIVVPRKTNGDLAIDFIESLVRSYKDYHIAEVNEYLNASGFDDCTLTTEEENALGNINLKTFGVLHIGDYYHKVELKKGKFNKRRDTRQTPDAKHNISLVNAKHGDNGIMYYGDPNVFDSVEMTIDIVQNGAIATGDVYPQPQRTGILWDAYLIKAIRHKESVETLIFFSTAIEKAIKKKYSYDNKAYWNHVKNDSINLPITSEGDVDYAYMETYIRAIMKQIIGKLKAAMAIDSEDVVVEEENPIILDSVPCSDRFTRYLPLYDVAIACGALVDEGVQSLGNNDVDMEGWIDVLDYGLKTNEQMFVVYAKGESMLPKIHPGDLCVFERYGGMGNAGSRDGQIVLARQHGKDNDYNCQYTIKEYHSVKDPRTGRNIKVELRPLNPDPKYKVIDVEEEDGEVRIVATLKRVL